MHTIFVKRLVTVSVIAAFILTCVLYAFWLNESSKRYNIVFILIDALRQDHLGCYGYERPTSPHIDEIARRGIVFTDFNTTCPWTIPSVAVTFTGLYPQAMFTPEAFAHVHESLPKAVPTIAEILGKNGYDTIGLSDHVTISRKFGYDRGFGSFVELFLSFKDTETDQAKGSTPEYIAMKLREELARAHKKNFFVYLHVIYPHDPYVPPEPYGTMFGMGYKKIIPEERPGVINRYDGEIRYADRLVGNVCDVLREGNFLKSTYLIITSDHGEGFWEHGLAAHGNSLYPELLKIPFIVYPPGGLARGEVRVNTMASNIDVFPTILDIARVKRVPDRPGKSLVPLMKGKAPAKSRRYLFAENQCLRDISQISVRNDRYHYIYSVAKGTGMLYDIKSDPRETEDLAHSAHVPPGMKESLIRHKDEVDAGRALVQNNKAEFDQEMLDQLKALGYIQ
ncbi:MAG: sulfatase [Candidatus Omnitrophica bacterium]|nr:sulfatase [Candidatus Omnitrophota bacterium]